jgi:AraC family transcriptional regulator
LGKLAVAARPHADEPCFPRRTRGAHPLARGDDFAALDCVCHLGARSPASRGVYARAKIAVVLSGAFHARSRQGSVVVGPGSMLLGNASADYEHRHLDDGGDRSIVFEYDEQQLEELGLGRAAFHRACVPASAASAHAVALARHALSSGAPDALREAALSAAAVVVAAERDRTSASASTAPEAHRITRTLRYLEAHYAGDCSLDTLAAHARLSPFHFLRVFRAATGQTPRQLVIALRLRAAATALRDTRASILDIALDTGFGDLSHFTTSFRRAFGLSPRAYRKR